MNLSFRWAVLCLTAKGLFLQHLDKNAAVDKANHSVLLHNQGVMECGASSAAKLNGFSVFVVNKH